MFPGDLLPHTYPDPTSINVVKGRTELERRQQYISTLEGKLGKENGLVILIKECLVNDPGRRPTASGSLDRMREMVTAQRPPFLHLNRYLYRVCLCYHGSILFIYCATNFDTDE